MSTNESIQAVVSVVIPSRNRSQLVSRAVKSALAQTYKAIEVIVIVDGPDETTVRVVEEINDSRLRVIELPVNVGPSGARNTGVREARGTWIAFLDDDDEWLPQKLERQIEIANHSHHTFPIIATRFIGRSSKGDFIWPKKLMVKSENISEYLFVRNSLFKGEKFIATPTLLTKKKLLQKIPFNNLRRHEDWDWLLRTSKLSGVGIEFVPEELCICAMQLGRKSLSSKNDWKYSLEWIRSVRELITPLAYSAFIVVEVTPQASSEGNWKVFFVLLSDIIEFGKPRFIDFLLYFAMWLFPQKIRQDIRYFFEKKYRSNIQKSF